MFMRLTSPLKPVRGWPNRRITLKKYDSEKINDTVSIVIIIIAVIIMMYVWGKMLDSSNNKQTRVDKARIELSR